MPGPTSSVALHPQRSQIDTLLAQGLPIAVIARRFNLSDSAVYRYQNRQAFPDFREGLNAEGSAPSGTVLDQLLELVQQLGDQRRALRGTNLMSRAASAEMRAIDTLLNRLGVDHEDVAEQMRDAWVLVQSVGRVVRKNPELGRLLAADLFAHGATPDLTAAIRSMLPDEGQKP